MERVQREARAVPGVTGKRASAIKWGTWPCSSCTLTGFCFLVQWLLWAYAHISNYTFFLLSLYPVGSKIHYSNFFSVRSSQRCCPSVIFPLSLLRCKLNPYRQTTPWRCLFCPFFHQFLWTFCTDFLVNKDIHSPCSSFTIKMARFLPEDYVSSFIDFNISINETSLSTSAISCWRKSI